MRIFVVPDRHCLYREDRDIVAVRPLHWFTKLCKGIDHDETAPQ